uniref:SJCHGC07034 protein n=1 Tax=Schistosoma japonicum TaxID=6182 RepID=Q5BRY4_SCHJA|nr:SJCHGC07034 protein [Schistosoma japonicum]
MLPGCYLGKNGKTNEGLLLSRTVVRWVGSVTFLCIHLATDGTDLETIGKRCAK